jgi:hypothetical protein
MAVDPASSLPSKLLELDDFVAALDEFIDLAEAGQSFEIVHKGMMICRLLPPSTR